jgi:pilus assembly protein CpaD
MRSKLGLLLLAGVALGGCGNKPYDLADRGVDAVNTPVVTRADYVFDAAAPGGMLAASEKPRLDSWFRGLDLGYGDLIYVDAPSADSARYEVAQVAGAFGMTVQPGAPVTAGPVNPGSVRVIVTRTRAEVPNCPNWSQRAQPNFQNRQMSNYACAINSNLAAMVANPGDLVNGREGTVLVDPYTSTKAVDLYRATPPTGTKGLQDTSTKGGK